MPLWATEQFARLPDFNCKMPDKYSVGQREHILADPTNVSFSDSPYYYQVGKQISALPAFIHDYLLQTLFTIWSSRYQLLLLRGHTYHPAEDKQVVDRLHFHIIICYCV